MVLCATHTLHTAQPCLKADACILMYEGKVYTVFCLDICVSASKIGSSTTGLSARHFMLSPSWFVPYRNRSKYQPKGHFDAAVGGRRRKQKVGSRPALELLRQHRLQQAAMAGL